MNRKSITLITIMFLIFSSFLFSQEKNTLYKKILSLGQSKYLKHAEWSVYAKYVDSGKEIVSYNEEKSLTPASGQKVFTSSAALEILGKNYRFVTKLFYDGKIIDSTLYGNVYIKGDGDPTLGSSRVKGSLPLDSLMQTWQNALEQKGIKRIKGAVIADDFFFSRVPIPGQWYWMDIGNYYASDASALTIHDNLYKLYFKRSDSVGVRVKVLRTEPAITGLVFENHIKTGTVNSSDNGYIYRAPKQYHAVLRGTIPAGKSEFFIKGSIPEPPLFAVRYFTEYLNKHGIIVTKQAAMLKKKKGYNRLKLITQTFSPTLKDIIYILNKKSFNLYAEQLLRMIGLKKEGEGSIAKGIKAIKDFLKENRIGTDGLNLYDGSGLSRSNTITAKIMVSLLIKMTKSKNFNTLYNSFSIAGDTNDVGNFRTFGIGTAIANNARIKSGYMSGVRSHSGYLKDKKGRLIAFSMIANNFTCPYKQIDNIHKQIMIELAKLN